MSALTAGDVVYPGLAALPGLDQVRALVAGRAPAPPVARLTGRRLVAASVGSATCTLPATEWVLGPKGAMHPGLLAFVADGAAIATVVSALPARVLCTTAELSLTFLGPPPPAGGVITARGNLMHLDDAMGLVGVHVWDANGRLVAHGTSRCSVFSPIAESVTLPANAEPAQNAQLRARLRGERSRPPVDQLTGIRLVSADPGRVVFALAASPWLRNEQHRGKRLAIATSELMHGDVRVAVLTGSTALMPP